jgi:hypothetical protein
MKLYPILYLNESQVSATDALNENYVVVPIENSLILLNKNQLKDTTGKWLETGENIVKGYISLNTAEAEDIGDIIHVRSSSAMKGWGPLLYQAAMKAISPSWLASDENLSAAANNVWNKMYEYSDLYERRYIGNIGGSRYECATALKSIPSEEETATEKDFLEFAKKENIDPKNIGCFWAYRKKAHDPSLERMIQNGKQVSSGVGDNRILTWVNTAKLP